MESEVWEAGDLEEGRKSPGGGRNGKLNIFDGMEDVKFWGNIKH